MRPAGRRSVVRRLRANWPAYAAEAFLLGAFMISAAAFGTLLEYSGSPARIHLVNADVRRALMGLAMCGTLVALVYSPPGGRSGAHLSPAVTLVFYRLGKVSGIDAAMYVAAQCVGAVGGIQAAAAVIGVPLAAPGVRYVATVPGPQGSGVAFAAEVVIAFLQMTAVLEFSNRPRLSRWTGVAAGALLALYITVESPLSGTSLNAARSLGSAWPAGEIRTLWIYVLAPAAGMLLAAGAYVRAHGPRRVFCAKLHHPSGVPCPFHCRHDEMSATLGSSHAVQHTL